MANPKRKRRGGSDNLEDVAAAWVEQAFPSTTRWDDDPKMSGSSAPQRRRRRRRAAPLGGSRLYGPYTPVSVTLTLRGHGQWLEVRAPSGRFFTSPHAEVLGLMETIIAGGHWVLDEGRSSDR